MSHVGSDGSTLGVRAKAAGYTYQGVGENVAWGQRSVQEVMTAWMNSPGHRANIMNGSYKHVGVGQQQGSAGGLYWTQLFGYSSTEGCR